MSLFLNLDSYLPLSKSKVHQSWLWSSLKDKSWKNGSLPILENINEKVCMLSSILVKRLVGSAPYSWVWNKRFYTGLLILGKLPDLSLSLSVSLSLVLIWAPHEFCCKSFFKLCNLFRLYTISICSQTSIR